MRKIKLIATIMSLTMALGLMSFATYAAVTVNGPTNVTGSVQINGTTTVTVTSIKQMTGDNYENEGSDIFSADTIAAGSLFMDSGGKIVLKIELKNDNTATSFDAEIDSTSTNTKFTSSTSGMLKGAFYTAYGSTNTAFSSNLSIAKNGNATLYLVIEKDTGSPAPAATYDFTITINVVAAAA